MEAKLSPIRKVNKTPSQVISGFFETYSPEAINEMLWEVFAGYAVNGPKTLDGSSEKELEIAGLFDSITDLIATIKILN